MPLECLKIFLLQRLDMLDGDRSADEHVWFHKNYTKNIKYLQKKNYVHIYFTGSKRKSYVPHATFFELRLSNKMTKM